MDMEIRDFVLCVKNEGYQVSLALGKVYPTTPDDKAWEDRFIRVIDESGEDYLYPMDFFVSIQVPEVARKIFPCIATA